MVKQEILQIVPKHLIVNGINVESLKQFASDVSDDPQKGMVGFQVSSSWRGGTLTEACVDSWQLAGTKILLQKNFTIPIDEPEQLLGRNIAPNPQQVLMAALNACMLVGFVAAAALEGVELEKVTIRTEGELDLRGFLGLDSSVKPGYDELYYTVTVKGNGTREQFERIHEVVMRTSPNRWNISNPVKLTTRLVVE